MTTRASIFLLTAAVCPLVFGCSSGSGGSAVVGKSSAALRRMQSCGELTQSLRDDALDKMNRRIDAEVRAVREGYANYYGGKNAGGFAIPQAGAAAEDDAAPSGTPAPSATPAHSETETQVAGVDEADIVKADGTRLYVLHGNKFLIVKAWPAASLGLESGLELEGNPGEMFVEGGKAVVFSTVDGTALYTAAGLTPRAAYSDVYASPMYPGAADAAFSEGSFGGVSVAHPLTKVTVLALPTSDGGAPSVTRELYFEGSYLSSRRVENQVRLVLEGGAHGPALEYYPDYSAITSTSGIPSSPTQEQQIALWEKLRMRNAAAIQKTTYADWLPIAFAKDENGVQASAMDCSSYYVPTSGSTEFGVTQVQAFDLDHADLPPRSVAIVGAAETVYGNTNSMVLAGRAYEDPWLFRQSYAGASSGGALQPSGGETLNHTHLHLFDLASDPGQPLYVGSGTVPGEVKDQFALDEKGGHVRVTTTEQRTGPYRDDGRLNSVSHVYVLQTGDQGSLSILGDAGEIAPGEQLYSTRYVGDKAYVVTWHVTDPLFVVDLANPARPRVLGELQIPGFSEYMHPLDDTHLLTIGRETDDTGHQHTDGGYWYGLSIQVFDVTDPLKPALAHKFVYDGGDYATSEATQNHKAFTYFDDRKLLAFPYVRQYGYGATSNSGPSSTLEVFHVDALTGIQRIGSVDHSPLLGTTSNGNYGYCGGYFDGSVRRGVFFENFVYSISYGGVVASDVSNLAAPVGELKLDAPVESGLSCGAVPL